jgi:RHS repeat-associated protein
LRGAVNAALALYRPALVQWPLCAGFPGQQLTLADLYYNQYRDYDPTTGRYIQADPIGLAGDENPYSYAGSNPVGMMDPLGLELRNLFPFEEQHMRAAADRTYRDLPLHRQRGFVHVFGHANPNVFCVYARTGPTCLTPAQFVNWLTDNHVNPRLPIMLWGCDAGQGENSFAAQLSSRLGGRPVIAATTRTLWRSSDGYVGLTNDCEWLVFRGR